MQNFELMVKNYRAFPDERPLRLTLGEGFSCLIGPNNSGKSAALRFFFDFRSLFTHFSQPDGNHVNSLNGQEVGYQLWSLQPGETIFSKLNNREMTVSLAWQSEDLAGIKRQGEVMEHRIELRIPRSKSGYVLTFHLDGERLEGPGFEYAEKSLVRNRTAVSNWEPLFELCSAFSRAMYIGPFRNAINVGGQENYFDIAIGETLIRRFHELKAGSSPDSSEAIIALQKDIARIFEFDELDLNASPDYRTLQVSIDGKSFRLAELGGGLSHFIVVLANVMTSRPPVVLLDEPELNLHATLQLDFLTTVGANTTEGTVVFATHSLGLARAAAERVYSVRWV